MSIEPSARIPSGFKCDRITRGWRCSRPLHHPGPCAGWPTMWTRLRLLIFKGVRF